MEARVQTRLPSSWLIGMVAENPIGNTYRPQKITRSLPFPPLPRGTEGWVEWNTRNSIKEKWDYGGREPHILHPKMLTIVHRDIPEVEKFSQETHTKGGEITQNNQNDGRCFEERLRSMGKEEIVDTNKDQGE